ncbi:MAG: T9SS type A sorting domain-containing protein [Paludibacter sp.]
MKQLIILVFAILPSLCYSQTLDVNFTGSCNSNFGFDENHILAQSFTAGISGTLTKIRVGVSFDLCTSTNVVNGTAKIYAGTCTGSILTTQSYSFSISSEMSMQEIVFTSPTTVTSGQVYTLQLSVIAGQNCKYDNMMQKMQLVYGKWHIENQYNCGGSYSGGTAYELGCEAYPADFYIQTYVKSGVTSSLMHSEQENGLFSIYPNPTSNQLNFKANNTLTGSLYSVCDFTGKNILTGKILSEVTILKLDNLSNGIYLLSIGQNLKQSFIVLKNLKP